MSDPITTILGLNAFDRSVQGDLDGDVALATERRLAAFGADTVLFYSRPLKFVEGQGAYLFDPNGRRYLDMYNNVPSVGHCHPRVVAAASEQLGKINVHSRYIVDIVTTYAERLIDLFPAPLDKVVFTCTGSESNDIALRLARLHTRRQGFIATTGAYHGNTNAVTEVSPATYKVGGPPPSIKLVQPPDARFYGENVAEGFRAAVADAMGALEREGVGCAGLIIDTIFSSDGIYPAQPGDIALAVQAVREGGGLVIADEVQPGFGRTGVGMWGFERHGFVPDIVTLGKPMGNGLPVSAVVTSQQFLTEFGDRFGYFNTFGGNPVSAAAGLAVIDVIRDEGLVENADSVGAVLKQGLEELAGRYDRLGAVRGAGLYIGVDIVDPTTGHADQSGTTALIQTLCDQGILIGAAGLAGATLKIRPPLCMTREDAGFFLETIDRIVRRA